MMVCLGNFPKHDHIDRLLTGIVDYADLDAGVAAEIVVRAKTAPIAPPPAPAPMSVQYPPYQAYGPPQYAPQHTPQPQQMPPQQNLQTQHSVAPSNLGSLITSLDGPALQKLLGAMSQTPQAPQTLTHSQHYPQAQRGQGQDLASLLHSVAGQQQQPAQQGYQLPQQQNAYPNPAAPSYATSSLVSPTVNSIPGRLPAQGVTMQQPQQPGQQQSVQDMLAQLARYRQ